MAVAMAALDASVVLLGPEGQRTVPVREFHRLPGDQPNRDTVIGPDEIIIAVDLPPVAPGAVGTYRKVRDRASYAFALVSVAAEVQMSDRRVTAARIALGGVAHKPWRAERAEASLLGREATESELAAAADAEFDAAEPLEGNEFKVSLARRTLIATLREVVSS
jgi:xanthine dehydrogenase YagS FAD-binding subunit